MKKSVRTAFSIFSLTFLFLFGGCELGLGESLDLEAPQLTITEPANVKPWVKLRSDALFVERV